MLPVLRRSAPAAGLALALSLSACSEDRPEGGASPTSTPAGCDGAPAPAFTGQATAWEGVARVEQGRSLGVAASQPTLTKSTSAGPGWAVARMRVSAEVVTNGVFAVGPESFLLVDPRGRACSRPRTPAPTELKQTQVDEDTAARGTADFLVPAGADLSRYRVVYQGDPSSRAATAAWAADGVRPTTPAVTGCSLRPSPMNSRAPRTDYGKAAVVGDPETAALRLTVTKPVARTLPPGPDHPNDVQGLAVQVTARAIGAPAFLDRAMFQMTDAGNHLCAFGRTPTRGEGLTSQLLAAGDERTFTLVFWTPEGAAVPRGLQVFYRPDLNTSTGAAVWYDPAEKPPYPVPADRRPSAAATGDPSAPGRSSTGGTRAQRGGQGSATAQLAPTGTTRP